MTTATASSPRHDASPARNAAQSQAPSRPAAGPGSFFAVPAPIKRLFDKFPLRTYPRNELPARAPKHRDEHVLYVFATEEGAMRGAPSFNPACLKWQTYMKASSIQFRIAASNNHASPTGVLPFLLPASEGEKAKRSEKANEKEKDKSKGKALQPIPSSKLQRWCMDHSAVPVEESPDMRYDAYLSLLDTRIRRAWLHTIYLSANMPSIAEPLYILPISGSSLVRLTTARDLRNAAEVELLKHMAIIDIEALYRDAEEAFEALEQLLGQDAWFFGNEKPGLFDASVFAYTHLLLMGEGDAYGTLGRGWVDTRLRDVVLGKKGLVGHRERLAAMAFPVFEN